MAMGCVKHIIMQATPILILLERWRGQTITRSSLALSTSCYASSFLEPAKSDSAARICTSFSYLWPGLRDTGACFHVLSKHRKG